MKEQIGNSVPEKFIVRLTNEAKKPYSKSGDIFMAEVGGGEILQGGIKSSELSRPKVITPAVKPSEEASTKPFSGENPKWTPKPKVVSPEILQINLEHYAKSHGTRVEELTYGERETVRLMLEMGVAGSMAAPPSDEGISPAGLGKVKNLIKEMNSEIAAYAGNENAIERILRTKYRQISGVDVGKKEEAIKNKALEEIGYQMTSEKEMQERPIATSPNIEKEGITNKKLEKAIDEINYFTNQTGVTPEFLSERFTDILNLNLTKEGESDVEIKSAEDQREVVIQRISDKIKALQEARKSMHDEASETQRPQGFYAGEVRLNQIEKDLLAHATEAEEYKIEQIFNRIYERAEARPQDSFEEALGPAGSMEQGEFFTTLSDVAAKNPNLYIRERAANRLKRYSAEKLLREILHNANYAVHSGSTADKLSEYIQRFEANLEDVAFSKKGVVAASHFWEQALLKVQNELGGYLTGEVVDGNPKEKKKGRVEVLARRYFNEALRMGWIKGTEKLDENGKVIYEMTDQEIDTAIFFARGLGIVNGTTIEIAAKSVLPQKNAKDSAGRLTSLYAQDLIKDMNPFRHVVAKFNAGERRNRVLAFRMNNKRRPWLYKELKKFDVDQEINVVNGLTDDVLDRYISVVNPFKIGGIFSRTTWRYGEDPTVGALGGLKAKGELEWAGTGILIEKARGDLSGNDKAKSTDAEKQVNILLNKIEETQPLKLFNNLRDLREKVLGEMGKTMEDEQLREDLDILIILQEKAVRFREPSLTFNKETIPDDAQRDRVRKLASLIKEKFNEGGSNSRREKFIRDLKNKEWKLPFNLGMDDAPFDEYNFGATGPTSIARRWRDYASEHVAAGGLENLLDALPLLKETEKAAGKEELVKILFEKIYKPITNYDGNTARDVVLKLSEGIIKFYSKDYPSRLPLGVGTLWGLIKGKSSFAQFAYGREAMAWDETDINEFTTMIRAKGMLTVEQQHQLQKQAGGGKKEVIYGTLRTMMPLISIAIMYLIFSRMLKEK